MCVFIKPYTVAQYAKNHFIIRKINVKKKLTYTKSGLMVVDFIDFYKSKRNHVLLDH